MAVFNGQLKIAKLLIDNKANVHAMDKNGHHIGFFAIDSNNADALKFCLRYKVDLEHKDSMNWTLLLRAVVTKADLSIVKLLLDNGCNVTAKDKNLLTACDHAMLGNQQEVMSLLEKKVKTIVHGTSKSIR
jgi:ankyrin repeat protein